MQRVKESIFHRNALAEMQTIAVTPLHVTALLYLLLFLVLFNVLDYVFKRVLVTGINYKILEVFTYILSYFFE